MNHEFWYLSRAAGFTAYLLLFGSVALGMMITTKTAKRVGKQNLVFDMHRFLAVLALVVSVFHVYVLLGDQYFNFSVWQLSIPFASPYQAIPTTIGVISMYLMVVVVASFWLRQFIGYKAWRTLHFASFLMYAGVTLHGITAGTDAVQLWARLLYAATAVVTIALLAWRIQTGPSKHVPRPAVKATRRPASNVASRSA
jgi:sulfoxide reductase heme-binding subunit YedZ